MYYSLLGVITLVITGYPISLLYSNADDLQVDDNLLAPFMRANKIEQISDTKLIFE